MKKLFFIVLIATILLFLCVSNISTAEPKCHMIEVEQCFDILHQLKNNGNPSALLTSVSGINKICKVLKMDFVGCVLSYIQKCATPMYKELSKVLSESILEHMNQICSPKSEFRNEIIASGSCLDTKVFTDKQFRKECNNPFFTSIAYGEAKAHSDKPERSVIDLIVDSGCCGYRRWEECAMPKIKDRCEDKGQRVASLVISKLLGNVPDFICSKKLFNSKGKICSSLPTVEAMSPMVNFTQSDQMKFSLFSLLKLFIIREA